MYDGRTRKRSEYISWKKRLFSKRRLKKYAIKERIIKIYNDSHNNYETSQIIECIKRNGEVIVQ